MAARALADGIALYLGHAVVGTRSAVRLVARVRGPPARRHKGHGIACDLLAVSGGWNPVVHLLAHIGGRLRYDESLAAFVPGTADTALEPVGAARGSFGLAAAEDGAGAEAGSARGVRLFSVRRVALPEIAANAEAPPQALWLIPGDHGRNSFVDLHNDVTAADIALAAREGYAAIEHVKRYTTLGMGTDQGKTGNVAGLALLSQTLGRAIAETGTTTFRPPLRAGRVWPPRRARAGELFDPVRVTPMHDWHVAAGAVFEDVGQWQRPRYYPQRPGEDMEQAVRRECLAVRDGVGAPRRLDPRQDRGRGRTRRGFSTASTPTAGRTSAVGRCRYGVMCNDDGMVFDDGVGTRLAPDRFLITTTTGNAGAVIDWLEEWLQTEWPDLEVFCTALTEEWANATLAGPAARGVLAALAPGLDLAAFPFMSMREADVAGIPARIFRVGFSGELSYEINVPADHGLDLWERLIAAGEPHGITPYGTEAMHVLRAEKGYVIVGQETDGSVTPLDSRPCREGRRLPRPALAPVPTRRAPTASSSWGCCRTIPIPCWPRARRSSPRPARPR